METVLIGDRLVGGGEPCFVIAEAGVNHNGDLALARKLICEAKEAGADAVKFQTFRTGDLVTPEAGLAGYQRKAAGAPESQYELLKKLELGEGQFEKLAAYSRKKGILFISSPFDLASVDLLERIGVPAYKIASGEITNLPLLRHVARTGKPVILSSGMATLGEVETAVRCLERAGLSRLVLLHCTSNYPASAGSVNLRALATLRAAFGYPVGYSDHTEGILASVLAASLGACVVEKHFTLDRSLPGPDHRASLEPVRLKALVEAIRQARTMLGDGVKRPAPEEEDVRQVVRKSLVAGTAIEEGAVLEERMVCLKRPGTGLGPWQLADVLGKTAVRRIEKDELLSWSLLR